MSLLLSAIVAASLAAPADRPVVTSARMEKGSLILELSVDAGPKVRFMLDSGSETSYVRPSTGTPSLLHLTVSGQEVATISPKAEDIAAIKDPTGPAGLLGDDFLSQVILGVDLDTGVAAIWPKTFPIQDAMAQWFKDPARRNAVDRVPLTMDPYGRPMTTVAFGSVPMATLVDTGSSQSALGPDQIKKVPNYPLTNRSILMWDGQNPGSVVLLASIRVGKFELKYPTVISTPGLEATDALIGLDVLSRNRWLLDLSGRSLYLRPIPSKPSPVSLNLPGVRVFTQHGKLSIDVGKDKEVPPGIYRVNRINGVPVSDAVDMVVGQGDSGKDVQAALERRGKFLSSILESGFVFQVNFRGKPVDVRVVVPGQSAAASDDIPPPPGPAEPGYHWKYERGKGWVQVKDIGGLLRAVVVSTN